MKQALLLKAPLGLDKYFISVEILKESNGKLHINMPLEWEVISLYGTDENSVCGVRQNRGNRYLISGGSLLWNEQEQLAVGLRDGNAVEPFCYTPIASGRCDGDLLLHAQEELESEILLWVKKSGQWSVLLFGDQELETILNNTPHSIKKQVSELMSERVEVKKALLKEKSLFSMTQVYWYIGGQLQYSAPFYVTIDRERKTIEYRHCVHIDLSEYDEYRLFYQEGSGLAFFKSLESLEAIQKVEGVWQESLTTHFLKSVLVEWRKKDVKKG